MNKVNWPVAAILILVLAAGIGWSTYHSYNASDATAEVQTAQIQQCERALAKSLILIEFMNQAADTRRTGAASESDPVKIANNLHAAKVYEEMARKYDDLTPKNCVKEVTGS